MRDIEKKIISVLPTVFIFGSLLFIILFIFALIGSNIYNFKKYENINFSSIYEAIISLFSCLTNGWENVHFELRNPMPHFHIPILLQKYEGLNAAFIHTLVRFFIYLERVISYVLRRLRNYLFKIFQVSYFGIYIKSEEIAFEESEVYMPDIDENVIVYNHKVSTLTYQKLHDTILEFQREFYRNFKTRIRLYNQSKSPL